MGMDVYGKSGNYFRNNVWWWRPLASMVQALGPASVVDRCKHWHSNDGDGLGDKDSKFLAKALRKSIEDGSAQRWLDTYKAHIDSIPMETCDLCSGTGIRPKDTNWDPESDWAKECGGCNGCHGEGKKKNFACNYPASMENFEEFIKFLEESEGFQIC
jgi:hypothetical protein